MKVLIAEDDPASQTLLELFLKKLGYEVITAENGSQAWDLLKKHQPPMIISDWMMPEMDGMTLCRKIRSTPSNQYCYIIILTAMDKKQDLIQMLNAGADDYIIKPFNSEELRVRIQAGERIINLENEHKQLEQTLVESRNKIRTLNDKLNEAYFQVTEKNNELTCTLNQLKKTQAQILHAEKMSSIGQLAAGVAHEINNPIAFISSNLKALFDYFHDIKGLMAKYHTVIKDLNAISIQANCLIPFLKQAEHIANEETRLEIDFILQDISDLIGESQDGTDRITKIVLDLKDFAHPREDELQLTDINKNLDATLNIISNELKYKVTVIKNYGNLPMVLCYSDQMIQVFMNLFINAAQAIETSGTITITTKCLDDDVEIVINDTGSGIPEENLLKIFDPFFTTKDVGVGTGLGLNVAYKIIEKHNGAINVSSQVGKGTTFTIRIPIKAAQQNF
jgi:signal transduction histidine kinase